MGTSELIRGGIIMAWMTVEGAICLQCSAKFPEGDHTDPIFYDPDDEQDCCLCDLSIERVYFFQYQSLAAAWQKEAEIVSKPAAEVPFIHRSPDTRSLYDG
jgi:hypothetical protein